MIQYGISSFLEELSVKDPEARVYIVYFNNNIHVPGENFEGYLTIPDIDIQTPEDVFELGKKYANVIAGGPIAKEKDRIMNNFSKMPAEGQTALGPALVFCFGLAS